MSAMQRRKGRKYEQEIARQLRAAFPAADVRRTSQADRAANSDVIVTGAPVLERLWLELQDARNPTPLAKLAQAERDIEAAAPLAAMKMRGTLRMPVVIWHRMGERSHQVTTRLWVLDHLRCLGRVGDRTVVSLALPEFIAHLEDAVAAAREAQRVDDEGEP